MEYMKRIAEIFMTACFLAFLALALAVTILREPASYSFFENRMLAAFPEFSAQPIDDGSYTIQLENYLEDHAAFRTTVLRLKARIDLAFRRPVVNNIVVTENCLLPYLPPAAAVPETIAAQAEAMAENLKRISDTVTKYGGYYCYVAVPCQYAYFEDDYPWYLNDRSELSQLSVSALSQALAGKDVGFLDIRAAFVDLGHPDDYGSRVDNHYTMQGAFQTYRLVLEKVAAETKLEFPILDWDDVIFETLPNEYVGSRERRLLNVEQRDEQLSILLPVDEISFTRIDNGDNVEPDVYKLPSSDSDTLTYDLYMGGDIAQTVIDTARAELPSILIYGDSFTNALECVLYLSFDKMYSLDLRHYQDMSLEDYIQEIQPEIVICIRDYEALLTPTANGGAN